MSHEQIHNHREAIENAHRAEDEIYQYVFKNGFSAYVESLADLPRAFELKKKCVCCMDEGTSEGYHAAGSGILLSEEDLEKYYNETGPEEITSHDGCGAAKLYAKAKGLDLDKADEYAREWAEAQAAKRGKRHRHVSANEMKRPAEGHFARTCYYDLTGSFNWDGVDGVLAGFVVSRKFMNPDYALKEVSVAFGIAFSDHGLGDGLLTEDSPFYLVAIADNEDQLAAAKDELAKLEHSYGAKVRIDGFIKPQV